MSQLPTIYTPRKVLGELLSVQIKPDDARASAADLQEVFERFSELDGLTIRETTRWSRANSDLSDVVLRAAAYCEQHGFAVDARRLRGLDRRFSDHWLGLLFSAKGTDQLGLIQVATGLRDCAQSAITMLNKRKASKAVGSDRKPGKKRDKDETEIQITGDLSAHHRYELDGSCQNYEPVVAARMAKRLGISPARVSSYFKKKFGNYESYVRACNNNMIGADLRTLNGDATPTKICSLVIDVAE